MNARYLWHSLLDFIDRHADLLPIVVMLAVLIGVGATCAGSEDDNTGHLDRTAVEVER